MKKIRATLKFDDFGKQSVRLRTRKKLILGQIADGVFVTAVGMEGNELVVHCRSIWAASDQPWARHHLRRAWASPLHA